VWQVPSGRECVDAVRWALELGYRHVDTAQAYGNEAGVAQGQRDSGRDAETVAELERSLERLEVERVDLYCDFTLSEEDLAQLDALDRTGRMDRALERNWW
jgi:diketogulonate reductase-like aldo/keto reductase